MLIISSNMKVIINNQPTSTNADTLMSLAAEMSLPAAGVAMAKNNKMIPRDQWEDTPVSENDTIIIIKAACGG